MCHESVPPSGRPLDVCFTSAGVRLDWDSFAIERGWGMSGRESVIAVVDDTGQGIAIWWVNISPDALSRMCGAWMVEPSDRDTLDKLLWGRMVLATSSGAKTLKAAKVAVDKRVDINASLAQVLAERARLQEAFDVEQSSRPASKKLKEPRWPSFPAPLDVDAPPPWDVNHPSEDHQDTALSVSHWIAGLCSRWSDLEEERLGRPMLRELGGAAPRPIPVVFA